MYNIECSHMWKKLSKICFCFRVKRTIPEKKMSQKSFTMSYRRPALLDPSPTQRQSCVAVDSLNSRRNYNSLEVKTAVLIPVRSKCVHVVLSTVPSYWKVFFYWLISCAQPPHPPPPKENFLEGITRVLRQLISHWSMVKNISDQLE